MGEASLGSFKAVPLEQHAATVSNSRKRKLEPYGYSIVVAPCRPPRHHSKPQTASASPRRGRFLLACWGMSGNFNRLCTEPDIGFIVIIIIDQPSAIIDD